MLIRFLIAAAIALAVTIGIGFFGWTQILGAHPFWSAQVTLIGAPIGVVLAGLALLRLTWLKGVVFFAVLTAAAFGVAHYGKTQFAASFAEDQFAGTLWYYGWIAAATFLAATVLSAVFRPTA